MSSQVVEIENARAFKRMGLPLNMPVEQRTFSADYSRRWFALIEAQEKFENALVEFLDSSSPRGGSLGRWRLVKRRFQALDRAIDRSDAGLIKLNDEIERMLFARFLVERAMPYIQFWSDRLGDAETENGMTIEASEIPPWLDPE